MSETLEEPKKVGRQSRSVPVIKDEHKTYEFELCTSYASVRPVDRKTDKPIGSPYPPYFSFPNHGIAISDGKARNWRYIEGQPSIWVDEQPQLENYEKNDIHQLLGQDENQLAFINGKMIVVGVQKLRLDALYALDYFEGNQTPYKQINKQYMFRLNNPDAAVSTTLDAIELEYQAMQLAHEATIEQMLAAAFTMGIDINDQSEKGLRKIKMEFLTKAKYDHKNPKGIKFFMDIMSTPATRIKYIFSQGLTEGLISGTQQQGKLTWAKPNTVIFPIEGRLSLTDELTAMVLERNEKAIKIMNTIDEQLAKL